MQCNVDTAVWNGVVVVECMDGECYSNVGYLSCTISSELLHGQRAGGLYALPSMGD